MADGRCPVCGEPVGPAPTTCPECNAPHHWDCWEYNGGCAIYSCPRKAKQRDGAPPALPTGAAHPIVQREGHRLLPPVPLESWHSPLPKNSFWIGVYTSWFLGFFLFMLSENTVPFLVFTAAAIATLAGFIIPPLVAPPAYTVDFCEGVIRRDAHVFGKRRHGDVLCLFAELDSIAIQWTATSSGARLELVARPMVGQAIRLLPTFEAGSAEAELARTILERFAADTHVPTKGLGNLATAAAESFPSPLVR